MLNFRGVNSKPQELTFRLDLSLFCSKVISYNSTMSAMEKGGQWQRSLYFFDTMAAVKLQRDVISYSVAWPWRLWFMLFMVHQLKTK